MFFGRRRRSRLCLYQLLASVRLDPWRSSARSLGTVASPGVSGRWAKSGSWSGCARRVLSWRRSARPIRLLADPVPRWSPHRRRQSATDAVRPDPEPVQWCAVASRRSWRGFSVVMAFGADYREARRRVKRVRVEVTMRATPYANMVMRLSSESPAPWPFHGPGRIGTPRRNSRVSSSQAAVEALGPGWRRLWENLWSGVRPSR